MSSSRILSSRPSASCITAKPIARTIRGRGRNASPFFAAQKQGKLSGLFHQRMPGALLYSSPSRNPHSPLPERWRFRTVPPEVGKLRAFPPEPAGALICGSLHWKPHSPLPGAVGALALPHRPAGNGSHAIKEKSGGSFLRFSDSRQGLLGAEDTVAGIAQAGNDVLVLVQMVIQGLSLIHI